MLKGLQFHKSKRKHGQKPILLLRQKQDPTYSVAPPDGDDADNRELLLRTHTSVSNFG